MSNHPMHNLHHMHHNVKMFHMKTTQCYQTISTMQKWQLGRKLVGFTTSRYNDQISIGTRMHTSKMSTSKTHTIKKKVYYMLGEKIGYNFGSVHTSHSITN